MAQPTQLRRFTVRNTTRDTTLAEGARLASSYWARFWGLMFKRRVPEGGGILLTKSSSLHGFFMLFRWDAIYMDDDGRVVKVAPAMRPWTISFGGKGAKHALEVAAGVAEQTGTQAGDQLVFEEPIEGAVAPVAA